MDIRKTRTCEKCKAVVPLDKVKLYPKSPEINLLVCEKCCEEMKAASRARIAGFPVPKPAPIPLSHPKTNIANTKISPLPPPDIVKYLCVRCDYVFRVDTAKLGITCALRCPYCGRPDKLKKVKA